MNEEFKPYEQEKTSVVIAGYDAGALGIVVILSVVAIVVVNRLGKK